MPEGVDLPGVDPKDVTTIAFQLRDQPEGSLLMDRADGERVSVMLSATISPQAYVRRPDQAHIQGASSQQRYGFMSDVHAVSPSTPVHNRL
jgi:hypothetical protein